MAKIIRAITINKEATKKKHGDNLRNQKCSDVIVIDDLPDEVEAVEDWKTRKTLTFQEVIRESKKKKREANLATWKWNDVIEIKTSDDEYMLERNV
nr:serine-threonine/tyrosine-protein kinase catalytic domain-containing protein [Tanacetum cinerariifolium]